MMVEKLCCKAQRIRIDRESGAIHDLILGWTSPSGFE